MTPSTSQQLKALVRNLSKGDSTKAQVLMSSYATERFLERVEKSPYRDNLILKGGALIASMIGIDKRSTIDIDTTIKNLPLSEDAARAMVEEIIAIRLDDNVTFSIKSVGTILDDADYPGVRIMMEASLDRIRIPMKLDFSTDDVITPSELSYSYKLLFEDRSISILAYNTETILAEKMQTIIARGTVNTRMRDFYDIYALTGSRLHLIDTHVLQDAFINTSAKRSTNTGRDIMAEILFKISEASEMTKLWESYRRKYDYAQDIEWKDAARSAAELFSLAGLV